MSHRGFVLGIVLKIVVIGAVLAALIYFSMDSIIEIGVEIFGSVVAQTRISISSVDFVLPKGEGTLNEVSVRNPEGFPGDSAIEFNKIFFKLDKASLTNNPVVIDRVVLDSPKVCFEKSRNGKTNIGLIWKNIEDHLNQKQQQKKQTNEKKRYVIKRFTIRNGRIAVKSMDSGEHSHSVRLPSITLTDIGGRNGSDSIKLGKEIVSTFSRAVIKTAEGRGVESYLEMIVEDKIFDNANDFFKDIFN